MVDFVRIIQLEEDTIEIIHDMVLADCQLHYILFTLARQGHKTKGGEPIRYSDLVKWLFNNEELFRTL